MSSVLFEFSAFVVRLPVVQFSCCAIFCLELLFGHLFSFCLHIPFFCLWQVSFRCVQCLRILALYARGSCGSLIFLLRSCFFWFSRFCLFLFLVWLFMISFLAACCLFWLVVVVFSGVACVVLVSLPFLFCFCWCCFRIRCFHFSYALGFLSVSVFWTFWFLACVFPSCVDFSCMRCSFLVSVSLVFLCNDVAFMFCFHACSILIV